MSEEVIAPVFVPYTPPAGHIKYTKEASLPDHIPADGAAVSRTTYGRLFDAVGEQFGAGDGSTTFNVPKFEAQGWNVLVSV